MYAPQSSVFSGEICKQCLTRNENNNDNAYDYYDDDDNNN
jgi:hypothetical protein